MGAPQRHDPASASGRAFDLYAAANHGVSFRVIAKWMRLAGVDHIHAAPWSASSKAIGDHARYYDICREDFNRQDWNTACFSIRTGQPQQADAGGLGCIHAGQMHNAHHLGEDVVLQFGGGTIATRWAFRPVATANRVALEAMILRATRAATICTKGRKFSPGRRPPARR